MDTIIGDFNGIRLKVLALNRQDITNLDFLANTPVLEELNIEGCRSLQDDSLEALRHVPDLLWLGMGDIPNLTCPGMLAHLPRGLECIYCQGPLFNCQELHNLFLALANIKVSQKYF